MVRPNKVVKPLIAAGAVALEAKLTNDRAFAAKWAIRAEPQPTRLSPHGLERRPVMSEPTPIVVN